MANAPVIFDDGGSTRIKQLLDDVNMDGLLGVPGPGGGPMIFQAKATNAFVNGGGVFDCRLRVRMHQLDGDQQIFPPPAVPGAASGMDLQSNDSLVITSQNGQVATVTFDGTFLMVITLTASLAGLQPIVEAKQNQRQRRYVVSNAGAIQTVTLLRGAAKTPVPVFTLVGNPSIYTMIHLS